MKLLHCVLVTITLFCSYAAAAITTSAEDVVFDFGVDFITDDQGPIGGIDRLEGTLTTNQLGTFTTESEIEGFFNSATYSFMGIRIDGSTVFTLNNASAWDLVLSGTGASASVTSSPTQLSIDFDTPSQLSEAVLFLGDPMMPGRSLITIGQSNNITDSNSIVADMDAIEFGFANPPYDSAITFPAVPEPSTRLLCVWGIAVLLLRARHAIRCRS